MKKLLIVLMSLILVCFMGACGDQGDDQQDEDGDEPGRLEDVEKHELVVDLRQPAVVGDVVVDVRLVETALRQQRPRDGRQRQQEQQRQGGAHAGQPVPRFLEQGGDGLYVGSSPNVAR